MTNRADKKKSVAKVAKSLINSPLQTVREIAKETWLWSSTVGRVTQELGQTKRFIDLMNERDNRTRILSEEFKKEISEELLVRYIEKCWGNWEAMKQLENYIALVLWDIELSRNVSASKRYEILNRANFKCQACWAKPKSNNDVELHVDHILPASLWWTTDIDNLQVLCLQCNISKSNLYNVNHNNGN